MAGGLSVSVRQVASYPALTPTTLSANDLVLVQSAGLGGPYSSVPVATLVANGLANPSGPALGVGTIPPANAYGGQVFATQLVVPAGGAGGVFYNMYFDNTAPGGPVLRYLANGVVAGASADDNGFFDWSIAPAGQAGAEVQGLGALMRLSPAGSLSLPLGTVSVARDPNSALEVATMGWVGRSTVASFNGRMGVVTLDACDIGMALGYPTECIATLPQVDAAICSAIQDLIRTYPAVWSWNGRVGDVWLNLADINWALAQGGADLIVPTPPPGANDGEAVNAGWVINYVTTLLAGPPAYATEQWVLQQIQDNIAASVTSFNGRTGTVTLNYIDVAALGFAPVNSPGFSGVPSAPTASPGTSSGQLATTAFVMAAVTAATTGVVSFNTRTGAVTFEAADVSGVGGALLASPNFTGTPTGPTPPPGDSSQRFATTAFVEAAVAAATAGVATWNGRTGNVTLLTSDILAAGGAPIASPGFSGIPTAPTAANGTNTTQLATTAFVQNELTAISAGVISFNGRSGAVVFTANDLSAVGGAMLASPAFTGLPTAPTAAPNNNSTQIATTAYVINAIQGAAVTSFNGRSGTVTLSTADITGAGGAPIASPSFSGLPTAPTAAPGNSSTLLATTAFVATALAGYLPLGGGVMTGPITLSGNATQPLQPVPLQQLTSTLANYATTAMLANYLPLTGGTLTGGLSGTTLSLSGAIAAPNGTSNIGGVTLNTGLVTCGNLNATIATVGNVVFPAGGGFSTPSTVSVGAGTSTGSWNAGNSVIGQVTLQNAAVITPTTVASSIGGCGIGPNGVAAFVMLTSASGTLILGQGGGAGIVPSTDNHGYVGSGGGFGFASMAAYTFATLSDPRKKKDTAAAPSGALGRVLAIPVINYHWLAEASDAPLHTGFDASQVQAALGNAPAVIVGEDEAKTLSLNSLELLAFLWQAVQELTEKLDALTAAAA